MTREEMRKEMLTKLDFGYVWILTEDNDGEYSFYDSVETARTVFHTTDAEEKTYGLAKFVDDKLEILECLGSTL